MENGGAKMEQCNNKTNKLDEIHRNSYEIRPNLENRTKFGNFTMPQYSHTFVRISYEFQVNFVQFANKGSKHTSKHTLP